MDKKTLEKIKEKSQNLDYGELRLIYHNGKLQYIEKKEKVKIK